MPQFTPETPTVARTFVGVPFTVPMPFAEGHTLTGPQAAWLNSNLASVVGNAFSGDIRRGLKAHNDAALAAHKKAGGKEKDFTPAEHPSVLGWDLQDEFNKKFAGYTLGESNRGSGGSASTSDPVAALIRTFSTLDIKARLAAKGYKVGPLYKTPSSMPNTYKSKWEELVGENAKAKETQFRAQAEAQLSAMQDNVNADDDILSGLTPSPTEEPEAEAA
jgi:hypothetical protein